jgi:hypothetical protein
MGLLPESFLFSLLLNSGGVSNNHELANFLLARWAAAQSAAHLKALGAVHSSRILETLERVRFYYPMNASVHLGTEHPVLKHDRKSGCISVIYSFIVYFVMFSHFHSLQSVVHEDEMRRMWKKEF